LLHKRLRQLVRVAFALAIGLVLAAAALAIWWLRSLDGLTGIGEPFNLAAVRGFKVPDERNAFTFLSRADHALTPFADGLTALRSAADPTLQAWVAANRHALELFLLGSEQADAANPVGATSVNGTRLAELALLEGGKRQESGDTAGAWECFRAVLRMTTHIRRRGNLHQRFDVNVYWIRPLRQPLAAWVGDPRTTIAQLRAALAEVLESQPRPE
jgi:hypothetical protein